MKKKIFLTLNILLLAVLAICTYIYMEIDGRLFMKGVTASCFVALGLTNLVYAALSKPRKLVFPIVLALGLCFAMAGELVLGWNFIIGAGVFAVGQGGIFTVSLIQRVSVRLRIGKEVRIIGYFFDRKVIGVQK